MTTGTGSKFAYSKKYDRNDTTILSIESERLIIRTLRTDDLENFLIYRTDPEVCRFQDWDTFDEKEAHEFIQEQQHKTINELEEWVQLAIELKSEDKLIGDIAFRRYDKDGAIAEIGYAISPLYQRQGFAFEAIQKFIHHLFTEHGVHRISARIDPRNAGSLGLLTRLNFVQEGQLRKCFYDEYDKEWVDEMMFGLLREDYLK